MQIQPIGQHIVLRLADNRVIFDHRDKLLLALPILLRIGRDFELLAFCFVDTHLHLEVACPRARAGQLARRLQIALKLALRFPVPFAPAHFEPILQQRHLYNTFRYIILQRSHHSLPDDDFFEACCLADLLGLRVLGGQYLVTNLRRWLPRLKGRDLLALFGVAHLEPVEYLPAQDAPQLLAAAAAAAGLPDLKDAYRQPVVAARCALLQVAGSQLTTAAAADLLQASPSAVRRLRQKAAPPELVRALRLQLCLRRPLTNP